MKTIKELEAEDTCHEDSYFKAGQLQAYEDVLRLIDERIAYLKLIIKSRHDDGLDYCTEHAMQQELKELKARITGWKQ